MKTVDGNSLVFCDEMGVRMKHAERNYARSRSGSKAVKPGRGKAERGPRHDFLAAMDKDGFLPCTWNNFGTTTAALFEDWVEIMLLPTLVQKYPLGGITVIMDNARCASAAFERDFHCPSLY